MQGATLFAEQLKSLDYEPEVDQDWVELDYEVPGGRYCGKWVRMAVRVPANFPVEPPGGFDFKPRFPDRPVQGGDHPERSHESRRFKEEGEYWSRPHPTWNSESKKDARTYMLWVQTLWLTT